VFLPATWVNSINQSVASLVNKEVLNYYMGKVK